MFFKPAPDRNDFFLIFFLQINQVKNNFVHFGGQQIVKTLLMLFLVIVLQFVKGKVKVK